MSGPSSSLTPDPIKEGSKVINLIGLNTKHADCRIIFVISNTFVTNDNFFQLIRKISPTYIFFFFEFIY